MKTELIKRAIESAQNRKYKLSKDLEHNISDLHRKKANGQREVMQVTIEALEKQIPKNVQKLESKILIADGWQYQCPQCKCAVGVNQHAEEQTQEDNYCPTCGQALDWSEENE